MRLSEPGRIWPGFLLSAPGLALFHRLSRQFLHDERILESAFIQHLQAFAEIILRVGLNLEPGQGLLIAEPYELQGVSREAAPLVEAVSAAAQQTGSRRIEVIWGDEDQLRTMAVQRNERAFKRLALKNTRTLAEHIAAGDALLFLESSHPDLMAGVPAGHVDALRTLSWSHFGPIARQLIHGATNWTIAPAPTSPWADKVYDDLPAEDRLPALWQAVFRACRVRSGKALAAWRAHLGALRERCTQFNGRRLSTLRFQGPGTDLTVRLPPEHRWCTAELSTATGRLFVANLPTEEIFTLPHKDSAEGVVRVARPVAYGSAVIDGIHLEFREGRVVKARARTGEDLLHRMLATDEGAARLGEVAFVPQETSIDLSGRLFYQALLDENASSHIALGEAYPFTLQHGITQSSRYFSAAGGNQSLIHVDLPLALAPDKPLCIS